LLCPLSSAAQQEDALDFIETWFGFSLDGGDGSTEGMIILVVAVAALLALATYIRARTRSQTKTEARARGK
jgi:hypothetical protein